MNVLGLFCVLLITSSLASAQTFTYSKIDEPVAVDAGVSGGVGWGSCVTCAGGVATGTATIASSPFITSPSIDGASRDFTISGSAYTNGLWWYKVGTNDARIPLQNGFLAQRDQRYPICAGTGVRCFPVQQASYPIRHRDRIHVRDTMQLRFSAFGMSGTLRITNGRIAASPALASSPTPGTTSTLNFHRSSNSQLRALRLRHHRAIQQQRQAGQLQDIQLEYCVSIECAAGRVGRKYGPAVSDGHRQDWRQHDGIR